MEDSKKIMLGMMTASVFVLIVGVSSLYVQTQIESGNACGCAIPIALFVPFLAAVGLFMGTLLYYFFVPPAKPRKVDKEAILKMFEGDEKTVMRVLIEKKGEATQSGIVSETGLSKVKVFRVLSRLNRRGVVTKEHHGKTNMIRIDERIRHSIGR